MNNYQAKVAEATLKSLLSNEWNSITYDKICKKLKLDKNKVSKNIKKKHDLLKNINQYFDSKIMIEFKLVDKSTKRDMLFEILMLRFDLLNRYRKSILKIYDVFKCKPNNFIFLLPSFIHSMSMMAKAANIETKGLQGNIKLKGILVVYFATFLIWTKDENPTLDKTMTSLDNYLERAESLLDLLEIKHG